MALPHRQWLATQVISDQQTVSYRTLARALKVHVNSAKRMLYDFHAHENAKKPGSVHATYLLAGNKIAKERPQLTNGQNRNEQEDEPMPSSPPPFTSSMLQSSQQNGDSQEGEVSSIRTITLVREESLEAVKSSYETITSIHVYSVSAYRLQDLQTLSDTGRHLYNTYYVKEDPLEHNKTYGVILNKDVRRRKGGRPPPPPADSKPTSKTTSTALQLTSAAPEPSSKKEETSRPSSAGSATPTSTTTKSQPSLKRKASDIFKSFAKAKNAPSKSTPTPTPKLTRTGTDSSIDKALKTSPALKDDSEGDSSESESAALFHDSKPHIPTKRRSSVTTSGKAEREAKLRKMMDDSDNDKDAEMEDAELIDPEQAGLGTGDQANKDGKSQDAALKQGTETGQLGENADDEGGVDWSDSETERQQQQPKKEKETEEQAAPQQPKARRRGRRKVMKKRTMRDEEGYLVTTEEAVWESFSEDEPVPSKTQMKSQTQTQTPSQGKARDTADKEERERKGSAKQTGKGKGGGRGRGNILSFFGTK